MCIIQRRWGKGKGEPFLPQSPRTYLTCQRKKYRRIRTGEREREGSLRKASINLGLPRSSLRHRKNKTKKRSEPPTIKPWISCCSCSTCLRESVDFLREDGGSRSWSGSRCACGSGSLTGRLKLQKLNYSCNVHFLENLCWNLYVHVRLPPAPSTCRNNVL